MKKRYFIQVGQTGLIYYSWLFVILFVGLIFHYEKTGHTSLEAILLITLFFMALIYSLFASYLKKDYFKLPYRPAFKEAFQLKKRWQYKRIILAQVKISPLKEYEILIWAQKKS